MNPSTATQSLVLEGPPLPCDQGLISIIKQHHIQTLMRFIVSALDKHRNVKPAGLLQTVAPPVAAFEVLGIDHLGPFPLSKRGNRHAIVCVDYLTKWVELKAVPDTTAERVRKFLIACIVTRHGVPKKIISDRGTAFTAECMRTALSSLGIAHGMVSACHAQANGLVERTNQTRTAGGAPEGGRKELPT
ncbi:hypothetical protein M514_27178 [Trichuris suis]|uniref:Integrase catalytic domain-containing protein n=1 Tax=Trichuris suis TaxID=68888 RepID=A0A085MTX3_9BILA|nr:hypothetical protein M514_27178 [Trichuris suis]